MTSNRYLPAEWHHQSMVQLTWPDNTTDWSDILHEVIPVYQALCEAISLRQRLLIIAQDNQDVMPWIKNCNRENILIRQIPLNDTWARDHGFITLFDGKETILLDFKFNGWGLKFSADKDNLINSKLVHHNVFPKKFRYENRLNFVLEGGSIESDGEGTLLTTSECLLSPNRNGQLTQDEIELYLIETLGVKKVLWLDYGYLRGDDTDSHIDTLARLAPENKILYVKCEDADDEHYGSLRAMEKQLSTFTNAHGQPFELVPLPMCEAIYDGEDRLPATYANFLFINDAVLVPVYGVESDQMAIDLFKKTFPTLEVIPINCLPLIKQHGSLHCVTMQFPENRNK